MIKKERDNVRARVNRDALAKLKTELGCIDCGYNLDARALEFDHKDNTGIPNTGKQRSVASLCYASWKRIMEEVSKCEIVCCNCHAIRTFKRRGL